MSDDFASSPKKSWVGAGVLLSLRLLWALVVVLIPLLGVWVASSIAAFLNGPIWAVCLVGLLAFPILPTLWEFWGLWRRSRDDAERAARNEAPRERFLTWWDRLTLRTLALNLSLLVVLLLSTPQLGFTALATRGDWMLQGQSAPWAQTSREVLFTAADKLEWLYELAKEDPYADFEPDEPTPIPEPPPVEHDLGDLDGGDGGRDEADEGDDGEEEDGKGEAKERGSKEKPLEGARGRKNRSAWPYEAKLMPVVVNMPPEAEASYESAARYIAERETDPLRRVKALHDFVADRIAYDAEGLMDGSYIHKQDLDTIWKTRKAVCAGYSRLMVAMGEITGDEILYITGHARDTNGEVDGVGHAWNAVRIRGAWYLMDVTWDAGSVSGATFKKGYDTEYFLTPPEVFGLNHLPEEPQWQLREEPLTRGEFMRQPNLRPAFYAQGFKMISPRRSQIHAEGDTVKLVVANPKSRSLLAQIVPRPGQRGPASTRCNSMPYLTQKGRTTFVCKLPGPGQWAVQFFSAKERYTTHWGIGKIEINR